MTSAFENLSGPGKPLRAEPSDTKEFEGLKRSGHARLQDALNTSLSVESRFDLAYNAAHALCLAALRWHGYRSNNRYVVFQLLPNTLNLRTPLPKGQQLASDQAPFGPMAESIEKSAKARE